MDVFEELVQVRRGGQKAALCTIVEVEGSIPSFQSAKMLIREDGSMVGTIGGGCTEAEVWRDGVSLRPNGDVLVASEEIAVAQEVPGDVMTAGGSITFDGAVGGSYLGAGAEHL